MTNSNPASPRVKKSKKSLSLLFLVIILLTAFKFFTGAGKKTSATFNTAEVKQSSLIATISATGTVEPEEVIDVGAQVAGRITAFGKDKNGKSVDYGSEVEAGMILAQIDDATYKVDSAQVAAQLKLAEAQVAAQSANLEQLKAKLDQASRDWDRAKKIGPSDAMAKSAYDSYRSAYEIAKANVTAGEASVKQAEAQVAQVKAQQIRTELNLGYCIIKSPVDGVIIDRRVNIGQTVVASLNAPSLFLIAKDLKKMAVWIAVNEADIGNIKPGQEVTFTVDAYPSEVFHGTVGKVRLNATMTQNVVTYTVEVKTDNQNGRLLPYLTANAKFIIDRKEDVLAVPNAALRYTPAAGRISPEARKMAGLKHGKGKGQENGEHSGWKRKEEGQNSSESPRTTVWVQDGDYAKPVRIHTGITDGSMTEIKGDELPEGTQVIVSEALPATKEQGFSGSGQSQGTTNPFAPQFPGRGRH